MTPPATPTGLTATAGDGQVALNWTASSGATGYNVPSVPSPAAAHIQSPPQNVSTPGIHQHRSEQRHAILICRDGDQPGWRKHEFSGSHRPSHFLGSAATGLPDQWKSNPIRLAGGSHRLALASSDEFTRHELGDDGRFGGYQPLSVLLGRGQHQRLLPAYLSMTSRRNCCERLWFAGKN